jgi:hypothetical protein
MWLCDLILASDMETQGLYGNKRRNSGFSLVVPPNQLYTFIHLSFHPVKWNSMEYLTGLCIPFTSIPFLAKEAP